MLLSDTGKWFDNFCYVRAPFIFNEKSSGVDRIEPGVVPIVGQLKWAQDHYAMELFNRKDAEQCIDALVVGRCAYTLPKLIETMTHMDDHWANHFIFLVLLKRFTIELFSVRC